MQCLLEQADLSDADARLQVKAVLVNNANVEESARPTERFCTSGLQHKKRNVDIYIPCQTAPVQTVHCKTNSAFWPKSRETKNIDLIVRSVSFCCRRGFESQLALSDSFFLAD